MSLNDLLGQGPTPTKIGNLVLDCVLREGHELTSKVTEFPVEEGATISDHVINAPRELTVEGVITNSPVAILGGRMDKTARGTLSNGKLTGKSVNRAELAFQELEKIHDDGQLITITGRFKVYQNMAMISAPISRDPSDGDLIRFSATFREVRKVALKTTSFKTLKKEQAQPKKNVGKTTAAETGEPVKKRVSIIKAIVNKVIGK